MSVSSPVSTRSPSLPVPNSARPLRLATVEDLKQLLQFEALCFEPTRRDTPATICRILTNPRHEVWVLDGPEERIDASLYLQPIRNALRIFSVATHPILRGQGWGNRLLDWTIARAVMHGKKRLTLEADAGNSELIAWYERHAFQRTRLLPSYYAPGQDAWRLVRELDSSRAS
jgi:ribosomal protein S18 acetylase RimI-like enzyme